MKKAPSRRHANGARSGSRRASVPSAPTPNPMSVSPPTSGTHPSSVRATSAGAVVDEVGVGGPAGAARPPIGASAVEATSKIVGARARRRDTPHTLRPAGPRRRSAVAIEGERDARAGRDHLEVGDPQQREVARAQQTIPLGGGAGVGL